LKNTGRRSGSAGGKSWNEPNAVSVTSVVLMMQTLFTNIWGHFEQEAQLS